jgi:hypothetical protein
MAAVLFLAQAAAEFRQKQDGTTDQDVNSATNDRICNKNNNNWIHAEVTTCDQFLSLIQKC